MVTKSRRRLISAVVRYTILTVWGIIAFFPIYWMLSTSFKPASQVMTKTVEWLPREVTLDNYRKVLEYPVATWAVNSVVVATVATALCVLFGAMAGYALARLNFPGRRLVFLLFLASIMIPPEVGVVPLLLAMIKVGWASTYQALILPLIGNVLSVDHLAVRHYRRLKEGVIQLADVAGPRVFSHKCHCVRRNGFVFVSWLLPLEVFVDLRHQPLDQEWDVAPPFS